MNEIIRKRKSVRKFDMNSLPTETLEAVRAQIERVKPLYPDIRYSINIASKTKGAFNIKAPHYLVFNSAEVDSAPENIGFIGQQLDLWLCASGLGSCWLGVAKPEKSEPAALPHAICIAFGNPAEPLHRELSQFRRKPLAQISEGTDNRLEAARLAPSGMNRQNWFFAVDGEQIHCYRKKPGPVSKLFFDRLESIDMGIAICHIAEETGDFRFARLTGAPERKGYIYMGTVG